MLMDIETVRKEIKKEKQPKQKKTAGQKRLIADSIAIYSFMAMLVSVIPGLFVKGFYDKDIKVLDDKKTEIYEQFMACEEFSDSFKEEFTKVSNDYANGLISYEEFDEKVKHLNSIKYAQEVLESSNNTELKAQVETINNQKQDRTDKYSSNIVPKLTVGTMASSGALAIGSIIASLGYTIKENNEKKRKGNLLTSMPSDVVRSKQWDSSIMEMKPLDTYEDEENAHEIQLKVEYDETMDCLQIITEEQENQNTL